MYRRDINTIIIYKYDYNIQIRLQYTNTITIVQNAPWAFWLENDFVFRNRVIFLAKNLKRGGFNKGKAKD